MILVFDASIEGFTVGLFSPQGALIKHIENNAAYSHTELLVPTIQCVLTASSIEFKDLTKIITTKGPGSFTGIRVGLATAAGLRAALNIPVVAVNTLSALVHSALHHHHIDKAPYIHTVLDTKCGDFYYQAFTYEQANPHSDTAPRSMSLNDIVSISKHETILTHPSSKPTLKGVACITAPLTLMGIWNAAQSTTNDDNLQPLYVRSANINPPKANV